MLTQNNNFLRAAYSKALLPCVLAILSGNINILIDGIIVGQKLGVNGLAALNLCVPVYLTLCVIGSFIVSGCAIASSAALGRNQTERAQEFYRLSIGLCLVVSLLVTVGGILGIDGIAGILCRDEALLPMVHTYTYVTLFGAAPKILLYVPFWYLRFDGRNREVTIVMSTMAGTNIILDYVFLFCLDMGMLGAALASVMAAALAAVLGFVLLFDRKSGFSFGVHFSVRKADLLLIIRNGSPAALNNLTQALKIFAVNYILILYGNTVYLAMFTAINCISEFSLCLIQGVPQAAAAMLGVYHGEHDNGSSKILMELQWKYGKRYTLLFGVITVLCSGLLSKLYGVEVPLYFPLACLALGLLPALVSSIFSGYYNVTEHNGWANLMICNRVFLLPTAALFFLYQWGASPWYFLFLGEASALLLWLLCINAFHVRHPQLSKHMLLDNKLEHGRKVLDFSVTGSIENICDACEKISDFCETNGMSMKQVMRLSLSMEELMTMILKNNEGELVAFDVRLFSIQETKGIRIRYNGAEYNPFGRKEAMEEEEYLGVRMIYGMVEMVIYQRVFGMNMLRILI